MQNKTNSVQHSQAAAHPKIDGSYLLHILHDLLQLVVVDLRAMLGVWVEGVADLPASREQ